MATTKYFFASKLWRFYCSKKTRGFTLTELLATILIAGIAISGLLAAMVELLQGDRQEAIREETQQEMQTALSLIAEDLREAVYIYDGTQSRGTPAVAIPYDSLPDFSGTGTPVIAFWKAEPLGTGQLSAMEAATYCNTTFPGSTNTAKRNECDNLKLKRRAYSLVVYLQTTGSTSIWKGKSRILRYELPQYSNVANLTVSTGFVDPARTNNFSAWPFDAQNSTNLQLVANGGTGLPVLNQSPPQVLVDFVDAPNSTTATNLPSCPTGYSRLPSTNPTTTTNNSFFTCVRNIGSNLGQNQDVIVYLRGNTYGRDGSTEDNTLSTLQTRVTLRGIIDKFD